MVTAAVLVAVNALGALALFVPAAWLGFTVEGLSQRGNTELDQLIRGEEQSKVWMSAIFFGIVAAMFVAINVAILAVRRELRSRKAWLLSMLVLFVPAAIVFFHALSQPVMAWRRQGRGQFRPAAPTNSGHAKSAGNPALFVHMRWTAN